MEAIKFVQSIRERVIENNVSVYRNQLETEGIIKDPIWKDIVDIYRDLSPEEKTTLLKFIRLIEVNTVSHIFGIIDGTTFLNETRANFYLTTDSGTEKINGDLQDIFLEAEESGE